MLFFTHEVVEIAEVEVMRKCQQSNMGAKNHAIILPDASIDATLNALVAAGFGAAGQRCMALSTVVFVGDSKSWYHCAALASYSSYGLGHHIFPVTNWIINSHCYFLIIFLDSATVYFHAFIDNGPSVCLGA